jgi:K+/H+ antiporter YhaU regulatory subunit KhtT
MPASKKNKENLKKAVGKAFKSWKAKNPDRLKKLAESIKKTKKVKTVKEEPKQSMPPVKKSREYNREVAKKNLELLRKQKSRK